MLRRLILMRHAKSSWDSGAVNDHARPLNKRGQRDAPRIAHALITRGWIPQQVMSSDSQRTRETWARMAPVFARECEGLDPPLHFSRNLYHAGLGSIQDEVQNANPHHHCLLMLGHNPGWESAASWLCSEWLGMTTANAALLELEAPSWEEALAQRGAWELVELLQPRFLEED